jgi:hypothetical protein
MPKKLGCPNENGFVGAVCVANLFLRRKENMEKYVVRNDDGSVNLSRSVDAFSDALQKWVDEDKALVVRIETAVEAVLDRHQGQKVPMPALLSMAIHELGASPSEFGTLQERIHAYVKSQAGEGKRLQIGKGKGGGVLRLARPGEPVPEKTETEKSAA